MDNLEIINGMNDAVEIIYRKRQTVASGAMAIWRKLDHAASHLNAQIDNLLMPEIPEDSHRPSVLETIEASRRATAEREGEERTRIGNTPELDTDDDWPTCKDCGSNLADDDDVEGEQCATCKSKADEHERLATGHA